MLTTKNVEKALALYSPPFKWNYGYIYDVREMVADNGEHKLPQGIGAVARVRGWGRIQYLPNPEHLQDTVGELIAQAVSEAASANYRYVKDEFGYIVGPSLGDDEETGKFIAKALTDFWSRNK